MQKKKHGSRRLWRLPIDLMTWMGRGIARVGRGVWSRIGSAASWARRRPIFAASALVACIGSTPTFRECLAQWSGVRTMEDMKRGYQKNPSEALVHRLDKLFFQYFEHRAGSLNT